VVVCCCGREHPPQLLSCRHFEPCTTCPGACCSWIVDVGSNASQAPVARKSSHSLLLNRHFTHLHFGRRILNECYGLVTTVVENITVPLD
jgi:hypothetical protein